MEGSLIKNVINLKYHCYQTVYTGNYTATPLSILEEQDKVKKEFLSLSKILQTKDTEKSPEQVKLKQEILTQRSECYNKFI